MSIEIKKFDFQNATNQEYQALNRHRNLIRSERLPDDLPIPLDEMIQDLKNIPDFVQIKNWVAWLRESNRIIGLGLAQYTLKDNLHLAQFTIDVHPDYRRRGLAKKLLLKIVQVARDENRRLLITSTSARVPAGEAFMNRIGAEKGLESHTNQLVLAKLDYTLVEQWIERAKERAQDFEIGIWEGRYPDEDIEAIVELYDLLNQQPFGNLDVEDFSFSADQLRQSETNMFARGYERWTLYIRQKSTGRFAGYTEVFWNPNRPDIIGQGITGVFPTYRNNGLGRWLKAEMLGKIRSERPQAKFVRTENADTNAPMMKINNELGFKPYIAEAVWQVATEKVAAYLAQAK
jgi:GNAT superfamily N-acetyltransferase